MISHFFTRPLLGMKMKKYIDKRKSMLYDALKR